METARCANPQAGAGANSSIRQAISGAGAWFFKQSFELKIKGNLIPETAVEELIPKRPSK
jgi:hypothetical protein